MAQQYAAVGVLSFPLFWLAGAGSAVFWIIGETFAGVLCGHVSMHNQMGMPALVGMHTYKHNEAHQHTLMHTIFTSKIFNIY